MGDTVSAMTEMESDWQTIQALRSLLWWRGQHLELCVPGK